MKLTTPQIERLFTFTQKHYVDWHDVQTELVDHLANGIETQWQSNPDLCFEDALQLEFKKFGVIGFGDVIEEKTKALNKRYWLLIWSYFKDFFKLPKIVITLFLIWGYYNLLMIVPDKSWIVFPSLMFLIVFPLIKIYKSYKLRKRINKQTQKKWLFDNVSSQLGGLAHFIQIPLQIALFPSYENWSVWFTVVFSVIIVLFSALMHIALYIASPKLRKDMAKQHPEYIFA